ncbi:DUF3866 family protein [Arcanobacterium hippocoleae]
MMIWRRGKVIAFGKSWSEALELEVELIAGEEDRFGSSDDGLLVKALAYTQIVGDISLGDTLLLSASAFKRGLGTGGYMFVVANTSRLPADPHPQPGHLMKARYTASQFMVQGVDEQESAYHQLLENADSIGGMPVICADLHSALPAIVLGLHSVNTEIRIAYVMSDGGALPAWFSRAAAQLKNAKAIIGTISCGQAFGGDLEAVNIYTALLAAKHVWNADAAIVAQGPGNLGTGTKWGFSGTQIGEAINAAGILGGRPIAVLRLSNADARSRHYGISHHTARILQDIVTAACDVPIPNFTELRKLESGLQICANTAQKNTGITEFNDNDCNISSALLPNGFTQTLETQISEITIRKNLHFSEILFSDLLPALVSSPYPLRTMGRSFPQDASAFIAAAAAGKFAAEF